MHRLRCDIAGALGAILFVAVGFAALREADALWDSCLFTLTLGLLLLAVLLAAHRTGARRAFWIGFALFGWGYLSLSLIPSIEPRLITTNLLSHLHQSRLFAVRAYEMRAILSPDRMRAHNLSPGDIKDALTPSGTADLVEQFRPKMLSEYVLSARWRYNKPEQYGNIILKASPDGEILRLTDVAKIEMGPSYYAPRVGARSDYYFPQIGHSLFALLAAWLGGVLSRRLGSVSETPGRASGAVPPGGPDVTRPGGGAARGVAGG
jgi:hypothetical protein